MKHFQNKVFRIKVLIMFSVGLLLTILTGLRSSHSMGVWITDFAFLEAAVFLAVGCWYQLSNLKAFSATGWGIRRIQRMVSKSKAETDKDEPQDFQSYVASRPHHDDALPLMAIGGVWLVLSILLSIPYFL